MTRTGQQAIQYALDVVASGRGMPQSGLCLQWTREPFAIGSYYYSAVDAWYGSDHRQRGDRNPPPAVPVWFDSSSVYEHVAFWCGSDVGVVTTFNAEIRLYPTIAAVENVFGPYAGWGPGLNEVQVWWPSTPTPPPSEEDDEMLSLIYTTGSDTWYATDGLNKRPLASYSEAQHLVDIGRMRPDTLAAGPKFLPADEVGHIPNV